MKTLMLILFFVLSSPAFAKKPAKKAKSAPKNTVITRTVAKKSEMHKFTGLRLKGQLKKPDLSYIYKRKGMKDEQILDIPENFNNEIIRSAGQF